MFKMAAQDQRREKSTGVFSFQTGVGHSVALETVDTTILEVRKELAQLKAEKEKSN